MILRKSHHCGSALLSALLVLGLVFAPLGV